MYIAGCEVSETAAHPYVIAEMASAHEGSVERAKDITRAAIEAGADSIKYQLWSRDENTTPQHCEYGVLGEIELTRDQWLDVMAYARSLGTTISVDVDDIPSLELALEGGAEALKIRTTNIAHLELLECVASCGKPILLATGAATLDEVAKAIAVLEDRAADLVLLHGFQAFPTRPGDTHLRTLPLLKQRFAKLVGYADHADGNSPLALLLPAAAVAAGACLIEKHITIDRQRFTQDYESALNGPQFKDMVEKLNELWQALGSAAHDLTDAEKAYRVRFKKSIVARRNIGCGEIITAEMLAFKRATELGISPDEVSDLVGKHAVQDMGANTLLSRQMVR